MTSWLKDLRNIETDDTHIILSEEQFKSLNTYEFSVPTSPSPGRVYKNGENIDTAYVFVVEDDKDKPGWQVRRPKKPLILNANRSR